MKLPRWRIVRWEHLGIQFFQNVHRLISVAFVDLNQHVDLLDSLGCTYSNTVISALSGGSKTCNGRNQSGKKNQQSHNVTNKEQTDLLW